MKREWGVRANDRDFEYFSRFVETMANLTLDKMYTVFDYGEDERLRDVNLRELVEFVREIFKLQVRQIIS